MNEGLDKLPLTIKLSTGETVKREDLLAEARIGADLNRESEMVAARIVRYGYLASVFAHEKKILDDKRKHGRAEFILAAKTSGQISFWANGDVVTKKKFSEKDIESAWRLDPATILVNQQLADAESSYELFSWLAKAHQSKSAQITNLQRKRTERN